MNRRSGIGFSPAAPCFTPSATQKPKVPTSQSRRQPNHLFTPRVLRSTSKTGSQAAVATPRSLCSYAYVVLPILHNWIHWGGLLLSRLQAGTRLRSAPSSPASPPSRPTVVASGTSYLCPLASDSLMSQAGDNLLFNPTKNAHRKVSALLLVGKQLRVPSESKRTELD